MTSPRALCDSVVVRGVVVRSVVEGGGAVGRRVAAALALAVAVGVAASCAPAPGASPPGTPAPVAEEAAPVLIVPGWELGCRARQGDWDLWVAELVRRGLPAEHVSVLRYDSCQPNLTTASMIADEVERLLQVAGTDTVNVVAHSMGAISTRWCLMYGGCVGRVARLVTVAGANHGTIWAQACWVQFWAASCADMHPGSPMLAAINEDETPDGVEVETFVSPCELAIVPRHSAFLDGAVNRDLVDECVDHSGWKRHLPTIRSVAARWVPGPSPGAGAAARPGSSVTRAEIGGTELRAAP